MPKVSVRTTWLLVGLLLLLGLAVWKLTSTTDSGQGTPVGNADVDPGSARPPGLVGSTGEADVSKNAGRSDPPPQAGSGNTSVHVLDANGKPVPGAGLVIRQRTGTFRLEARTESDGTARFSVPADRYRIEARHEQAGKCVIKAHLPATVTLKLQRGVPLTVDLSDWPEDLIAATELRARHADTGLEEVRPAQAITSLGRWPTGLVWISAGAPFPIARKTVAMPEHGEVRVSLPKPTRAAVRISLVPRKGAPPLPKWTYRDAQLGPADTAARELAAVDGHVTVPGGAVGNFSLARPPPSEGAQVFFSLASLTPMPTKGTRASASYEIERDAGCKLTIHVSDSNALPLSVVFLGYTFEGGLRFPRFTTDVPRPTRNLTFLPTHRLQLLDEISEAPSGNITLLVPSHSVIAVQHASRSHSLYATVRTGAPGSSAEFSAKARSSASLEVGVESPSSQSAAVRVALLRRTSTGKEILLATALAMPGGAPARILGITTPANLVVSATDGVRSWRRDLRMTGPDPVRLDLAERNALAQETYTVQVLAADGSPVEGASVGVFTGSTDARWFPTDGEGVAQADTSGHVRIIAAWKKGFISRSVVPSQKKREYTIKIVREARVVLRVRGESAGGMRKIELLRGERVVKSLELDIPTPTSIEIGQLREGTYLIRLLDEGANPLGESSVDLEGGSVQTIEL